VLWVERRSLIFLYSWSIALKTGLLPELPEMPMELLSVMVGRGFCTLSWATFVLRYLAMTLHEDIPVSILHLPVLE
jgi:hypothetical protein